jgi:hypothetical protein
MIEVLHKPGLDKAMGLMAAVLGDFDPQALCTDYIEALDRIASTDMVEALPEHVDILWHFHVLDLKNYVDFCQARYGRIIYHHLPETPKSLSPCARQVAASEHIFSVIEKAALGAAMQCSGPGCRNP